MILHYIMFFKIVYLFVVGLTNNQIIWNNVLFLIIHIVM